MANEAGQAQQWTVSRLKTEKNYANEPLLDTAVRKLNSLQAALTAEIAEERDQKFRVIRTYRIDVERLGGQVQELAALLKAAQRRNPELGYGYWAPDGKLSQGDGESRVMLYETDNLRSQVIQLEAKLKAATERAEVAEAADLVWVSDYGGNVSLNLRIEELEAKLKAATERADELVEYTEKVNAEMALADHLASRLSLKSEDQGLTYRVVWAGDYDPIYPEDLERVVREFLLGRLALTAPVSAEKAQTQRPWPTRWVTRHDPPEGDAWPAAPAPTETEAGE